MALRCSLLIAAEPPLMDGIDRGAVMLITADEAREQAESLSAERQKEERRQVARMR